jgi:predicted nucleic acid-binding protein
LSVVIDASVMLALVLEEPHTETVADLVDRWVAEGTELHAPLLAQYEIASALTPGSEFAGNYRARRPTRRWRSSTS